jgi:hypothetical protein
LPLPFEVIDSNSLRGSICFIKIIVNKEIENSIMEDKESAFGNVYLKA